MSQMSMVTQDPASLIRSIRSYEPAPNQRMKSHHASCSCELDTFPFFSHHAELEYHGPLDHEICGVSNVFEIDEHHRTICFLIDLRIHVHHTEIESRIGGRYVLESLEMALQTNVSPDALRPLIHQLCAFDFQAWRVAAPGTRVDGEVAGVDGVYGAANEVFKMGRYGR